MGLDRSHTKKPEGDKESVRFLEDAELDDL